MLIRREGGSLPHEISIAKVFGDVKQAILKGGAQNVTVRQPHTAHPG
jgi:hypothetical protein